MTLQQLSKHPAIVGSWATVGPVLIAYLEKRCVSEARNWVPGDTADAKAARTKAFADLADDFQKVGVTAPPAAPRLRALEPET